MSLPYIFRFYHASPCCNALVYHGKPWDLCISKIKYSRYLQTDASQVVNSLSQLQGFAVSSCKSCACYTGWPVNIFSLVVASISVFILLNNTADMCAIKRSCRSTENISKPSRLTNFTQFQGVE